MPAKNTSSKKPKSEKPTTKKPRKPPQYLFCRHWFKACPLPVVVENEDGKLMTIRYDTKQMVYMLPEWEQKFPRLADIFIKVKTNLDRYFDKVTYSATVPCEQCGKCKTEDHNWENKRQMCYTCNEQACSCRKVLDCCSTYEDENLCHCVPCKRCKEVKVRQSVDDKMCFECGKIVHQLRHC